MDTPFRIAPRRRSPKRGIAIDSMQADFKSILEGPEYFLCEKAHCRMRFAVCVQRQAENDRASKGRNIFFFPHDVCVECRQGVRNMKAFERKGSLMQKNPNDARQDAQEPGGAPAATSRRDAPSESNARPETVAQGKKAPEKKESPEKRQCIECHERPTMTPRAPYCAKCMAARGNRKRWEKVAKQKATGASKPLPPERTESAVTIKFGKYTHLLEALIALAEKEMRPLDMQILFILNRYLEGH